MSNWEEIPGQTLDMKLAWERVSVPPEEQGLGEISIPCLPPSSGILLSDVSSQPSLTAKNT